MKLYWCKFNNFGDALNEYIFERCFDVKADFYPITDADAIGIGSVLENALLSTKDLNKIIKIFLNKNKPLYVLSSGFGWEEEHYTSRIRFFKSMILKRNLKIVSLRGKNTLALVEKFLNTKIDNPVLGDLGLLASELLKQRKTPTYDIGIVPHYADFGNPVFEKIFEQNPNSIIIDTMVGVEEFMKQISRCKSVISTGMHPLIAADSLGIPNLWCRISEKTTTRFKYADYYSVFDLNIQPINLYETDISKDFIIQNYKISYNKVNDIKQQLINTYKDFFASGQIN